MNLKNLKIGDVVPSPPSPKPEEEIVANWIGDTSGPLVSIICHTYNHVDFIEDSLNSFLMQKTTFPFEIILHDDASSDGTTKIVNKYAKAYPNIIIPIIQSQNQYSKGIKPSTITFPIARGKYIAMCEGDDYWTDPYKIQLQASFLEENKHISICGHNSIKVHENRYISSQPITHQKDFEPKKLKEGIFIQLLTAMFVNKLQTTPDESKFILNGDDFLFSRLGQLGGYKFFDNISPGVYRQHGGGIWSALDKKTKYANRLNSFYWMSQYYLRTGDISLASHYAGESAITALIGTNKFSMKNLIKINKYFVRLFIKEKVPFAYVLKKKIDSK